MVACCCAIGKLKLRVWAGFFFSVSHNIQAWYVFDGPPALHLKILNILAMCVSIFFFTTGFFWRQFEIFNKVFQMETNLLLFTKTTEGCFMVWFLVLVLLFLFLEKHYYWKQIFPPEMFISWKKLRFFIKIFQLKSYGWSPGCSEKAETQISRRRVTINRRILGSALWFLLRWNSSWNKTIRANFSIHRILPNILK